MCINCWTISSEFLQNSNINDILKIKLFKTITNNVDPRDILEIKASEYMAVEKKVQLEKVLKFYFGLKHAKMITQKRKLIDPFTSENCSFILRAILSFSRTTIYFQKYAFVSSNCPFLPE